MKTNGLCKANTISPLADQVSYLEIIPCSKLVDIQNFNASTASRHQVTIGWLVVFWA